MPEPSATYSCKILPLGNLLSIAIAVNISMGLLFLCIFLDIPFILNMAVFLGSLFIIFFFISSFATFTISSFGISRELSGESAFFRNAKAKDFSWEDVRSYKQGTDRGKHRGEYQYLEINFKSGDSWKITDMYGERKTEYDIFLRVFLSYIEKYNASKKLASPAVSTASHFTMPDPIVRKKTIYETIYGKLFTVGLGVVIILFLLYGEPYMSGSSMYKLYAVLIPGFMYMVYRVFIKKE